MDSRPFQAVKTVDKKTRSGKEWGVRFYYYIETQRKG